MDVFEHEAAELSPSPLTPTHPGFTRPRDRETERGCLRALGHEVVEHLAVDLRRKLRTRAQLLREHNKHHHKRQRLSCVTHLLLEAALDAADEVHLHRCQLGGSVELLGKPLGDLARRHRILLLCDPLERRRAGVQRVVELDVALRLDTRRELRELRRVQGNVVRLRDEGDGERAEAGDTKRESAREIKRPGEQQTRKMETKHERRTFPVTDEMHCARFL